MSTSNRQDTGTVALLVLGAIVLLPLLTMGIGFGTMMGYGGMMGQYGGTGGWWPILGMVVPLAVVLGVGYLLLRGVTDSGTVRNSAMAELRASYARGDLSDEEFESRRERLERSR